MPRLVVFCPDCHKQVKLTKNGSLPEHLHEHGAGRGIREFDPITRRWVWGCRCDGMRSGNAATIGYPISLWDRRVILPARVG